MLKKIGVSILCITLILAFVGCSSPAPTSTTEKPEATEAVTSTETTDSAQQEPVAGPQGLESGVELQVWTGPHRLG